MAEYHDRGWVVTRPDKNEQLLVRLVVPEGHSLPAGIVLEVDVKPDTINGAGVWTPLSLIAHNAFIQEVRT